MPQTLLLRRAQARELTRPTLTLVRDAPDPVRLRATALAELSELLGLDIVSVVHQPPMLTRSVGKPTPTPARLLAENGREVELAWFVGIRNVGIVVLGSSDALLDWQRLDRWRAATTGRDLDTLPLLRRASRQRAVALCHQIHALQ